MSHHSSVLTHILQDDAKEKVIANVICITVSEMHAVKREVHFHGRKKSDKVKFLTQL